MFEEIGELDNKGKVEKEDTGSKM